MIPIRLPEADTHIVGSAGSLNLRAKKVGNFWLTLWEPTPAEAKIIGEGGHVQLWVDAVNGHPAVRLTAASRLECEFDADATRALR